MARFRINISGCIELDAAQIWPDGDGPRRPSAEDVVDHIVEGSGGEPAHIIRDLNLGQFVHVDVDGVPVER